MNVSAFTEVVSAYIPGKEAKPASAPPHGEDLCILAQPGSRLPGRALFTTFHIGDGLSIKPIRSNWLKRFERLPGGRQVLPAPLL